MGQACWESQHRQRIFSRPLIAAVLIPFVLGCQAPRKQIPLEPLPMAEAARIVNDNVAKIQGTLRAVGHVDGYFTTESGRRRSYHLEGILFYLTPCYLRLDLRSLGRTQFLFGSNATHHWCQTPQDDGFYCARHDEQSEVTEALPARPDQLLDALGLTVIPIGAKTASGSLLAPRVEADVQQILFVGTVADADADALVRKEYWLDRFPPRLVRRVIFRDADGVAEMESQLDEYAQAADRGVWLPHRVTAQWPQEGALMKFTIRRWESVPQVTPRTIQFTTPDRCLKSRSEVRSARTDPRRAEVRFRALPQNASAAGGP